MVDLFISSSSPLGFRKQLARFEAVLSGAEEKKCDDSSIVLEQAESCCLALTTAASQLPIEATMSDIFMGAFLESEQQQLQQQQNPIDISHLLS